MYAENGNEKKKNCYKTYLNLKIENNIQTLFDYLFTRPCT